MVRYFLSKSFSVLVINVFTAIFVTIAVTSFMHSFKMTYVYQDGLGEGYAVFSVDSSSESMPVISDVVDSLKNESTRFELLRYDDTGTCGVYANTSYPVTSLIDGRNFSELDFSEHLNTAIVSDVYKNQCVNIDGMEKILIGSAYYDVIGYFEYIYNNINPNAYVYYNLNSENVRNNQVECTGQFALDAGSKSKETVGLIDKELPITILQSKSEQTVFERISAAIFSQYITILPLVLVIIAVLLNSINVTLNWIERRKREILARRICGASPDNILKLFLREYFLVSGIAFLVGLVCAMIISKIKLYIFTGFDFSPTSILLSYVFSTLISMLSIFVLLLSKNSKTIIEQRGI